MTNDILLGICIGVIVIGIIIVFLAYCICNSCGQADDYDEQTKGIEYVKEMAKENCPDPIMHGEPEI